MGYKMKPYLKSNKKCSNCGMLCTPKAFKYHEERECMAEAFKNGILRNEIENYGMFNNEGANI